MNKLASFAVSLFLLSLSSCNKNKESYSCSTSVRNDVVYANIFDCKPADYIYTKSDFPNVDFDKIVQVDEIEYKTLYFYLSTPGCEQCYKAIWSLRKYVYLVACADFCTCDMNVPQ